jgi:hypothetical protein
MKGKLRQYTYPEDEESLMSNDVLQLNRRDIPFVNNVMYLGVTFNRKLTWRLHIEKDCSQGLGHVLKDLLPIQK